MPWTSFTHSDLRGVNKRAFRLGLACNYGLDGEGLSAALERGVNYVFWTPFKTGKVTPVLKEALKRDREKMIVATGPTLGFFRGGVRKGAERLLTLLGTDYLDVFQLFWLGTTSAWTWCSPAPRTAPSSTRTSRRSTPGRCRRTTRAGCGSSARPCTVEAEARRLAVSVAIHPPA